MKEEKKAEMIAGYLDGFSDSRNELPENNNFSVAYQHGWKNGRDDRTGKPRSTYSALKSEADKILEGDAA